MNSVTVIYFAVGFVVVFIFSINYFNQPSYKLVEPDKALTDEDNDISLEPALPKYLTDRFEYNFYLSAYVLVTEAVYILLVLFLPHLVNLEQTERATLAPTQADIVLAAFIITGMAPNLPYISQLLRRSKLYLHQKAKIPFKGQAVYRLVRNHNPVYSDTIIEGIGTDRRFVEQNSQTRLDIDYEDFKSEKWTLEARWAKLSYLLYFLGKWSSKPPFKAYIGNRELQYLSIENSYNSLQALMVAHKSGEISDFDAVKLNTRLDATLHRTYRLVSCLLYLAARTDTAVDFYLDEMGYASSERQVFPIPWNTVVFIVGSVVLAVALGVALTIVISEIFAGNLAPGVDTGDVNRWLGYGAPFIVIPILVVLFAKRYLSSRSDAWPIVTEEQRYDKYTERPWHIYFLVALFAYIVGATILYGLTVTVSYIDGKNIEYITNLRVVLAWSCVVFVTSVFVAFRLDSAPGRADNRTRHRLLRTTGAIIQGLVTSGVVYFVYVHTKNLPLYLIRDMPDDEKSMLLTFVLIAFFLGVLINVATGLGRLRQRRKFGRRVMKRQLLLNMDGEKSEVETINVSREGALVVSNDRLSAVSGIDELRKAEILVSSKNGDAVQAKVIDVREDRIHLSFSNTDQWFSLQKKLGVPSSI